nr:hypothetical protein [Tanacetum cinerariifolium]
MRIEQYFLMTDYSLWEVILNGDSPPPTRIVDGDVQIIAPTTAEQMFAKKNKLKARGTLLMALPDKHQLKNKADLKEQSLDDLFNNLKIYEAEVKGSSPSSQNTQNIAFVSLNTTDSINESVTAALSISAASSKATVSTLPNVDSLSDAVIYSFFAKLHSYVSDNRVPKNAENDRYKTGEGYHAVPPPYTGTFMPLKPDLVFTGDPNASKSVANVFNVESSTNKPSKDMSKTHRPDAPIVKDWISDSEDETKTEEYVKKVEHHKQATNLRTNNQKSRGHNTNWNNKACFVCGSLNRLIKDCDNYEKQMVQKPVWNSALRVNHQNSVRMNHPHSNRNVVPTTILTRSRLVSLNAARPVPTAVTQSTVKSPRPVKQVVNKEHSPGNPQQALKDKWVIDSGCSRHMTGNISFLPDFEEIDGGYVAFGENPKGGKISGKGKIKTSKLDFNDVYFVKELKFNFFSVSQMVSRENNMYNVDLKNVVPLGGLTLFFCKGYIR